MDTTLNTSSLKITNEILGLIAEIDEFKGTWRAIGRIAPERLSSLRRVATIESVGSPAKIAGRRDDRDTLKGIEVKEVGIAGDNETGFTVDSKFEEFVVAGIAARADCVNDWDHLGDAAEETQKLLAFFYGNVGIEPGASENVS